MTLAEFRQRHPWDRTSAIEEWKQTTRRNYICDRLAQVRWDVSQQPPHVVAALKDIVMLLEETYT
jgi:hypothetical protein